MVLALAMCSAIYTICISTRAQILYYHILHNTLHHTAPRSTTLHSVRLCDYMLHYIGMDQATLRSNNDSTRMTHWDIMSCAIAPPPHPSRLNN